VDHVVAAWLADPDRAGRIAHVRKEAAKRIFNVEMRSPVAFVEPGVVDMLEKMQEGETSGD